ncbi:MAG TPA: VIT1/CCC1 transporter family protein [Acidimicrobiales bacterium]|nr:VIT1/CCC1 transporter family protein [Acidimicrobiales bacterium]
MSEAHEPLSDLPLDQVSAAVHHDHRHRSIGSGGARAAVFGASDGLVSNVSLILGVAGANPSPGVVRLAGIAGLIAGAVSMAAGEYVSMRAQQELLERELAVEREAQRRHPELELIELAKIYESRGMRPELAHELAVTMMRDPEVALETHAREELGIDPDELGSPLGAAAWSFGAFSAGAIVPLIPWLVGGGTAAVVASVVLGMLTAAVIGVILATFTGRSRWFSALRQTAIAVLAGAVTYLVGSLVGVGV